MIQLPEHDHAIMYASRTLDNGTVQTKVFLVPGTIIEQDFGIPEHGSGVTHLDDETLMERYAIYAIGDIRFPSEYWAEAFARIMSEGHRILWMRFKALEN